MELFIYLILGFEIYVIEVFLVSHVDTRSGLTTCLKLTAMLGCADLPGARRDLLGRQFYAPMKSTPTRRYQNQTQQIRRHTLMHK